VYIIVTDCVLFVEILLLCYEKGHLFGLTETSNYNKLKRSFLKGDMLHFDKIHFFPFLQSLLIASSFYVERGHM